MANERNTIFLLLVLTNVIITSKCHEENRRGIMLFGESSSVEMPRVKRRTMRAPELQYEGIPIDVEGRRAKENLKEIATTTRPYPPLSRRYRRIYNPDEVASVTEYPFMAAVLVNDDLWCGGVVIESDAVLTAAHCLQLQYNNRFFREYVKMLTVRVGSDNATADGEVLRVTEIFFHPNYKPQTLQFNYAVVKLHRNLTLGRNELKVNSIVYAKNNLIPTNRNILFLGWGSVLGVGGSGGEVLLQKIEVPIYDLADCQDIYGRDLVTRNNFCAGFITIAKNVCNHDAGGPAIMDGVLVGILSFSSNRCDQVDRPAVFSNVGAVSTWLGELGEKKVQLGTTSLKTSDILMGVEQ